MKQSKQLKREAKHARQSRMTRAERDAEREGMVPLYTIFNLEPKSACNTKMIQINSISQQKRKNQDANRVQLQRLRAIYYKCSAYRLNPNHLLNSGIQTNWRLTTY